MGESEYAEDEALSCRKLSQNLSAPAPRSFFFFSTFVLLSPPQFLVPPPPPPFTGLFPFLLSARLSSSSRFRLPSRCVLSFYSVCSSRLQFSDGILDLVNSGAVTGSNKVLKRALLHSLGSVHKTPHIFAVIARHQHESKRQSSAASSFISNSGRLYRSGQDNPVA